MMNALLARLIDHVMKRVDQRLGQVPMPRWGVVQSVDPSSHTLRATLEPEHSSSIAEGGPPVLTGWLPVPTANVGAGWRMSALPAQGQQVFMAPEYGDAEHMVVLGVGHSTANLPAQAPSAPASGGAQVETPGQPGEVLLSHSGTGAVLRLTAVGGIYSKGAWVHEGTFDFFGTLAGHAGAGGAGDVLDAHGSLDRLRGNYNVHAHPTGPKPNPQDPE